MMETVRFRAVFVRTVFVYSSLFIIHYSLADASLHTGFPLRGSLAARGIAPYTIHLFRTGICDITQYTAVPTATIAAVSSGIETAGVTTVNAPRF